MSEQGAWDMLALNWPEMTILLTYLGYLVDDLHWSRWVLSGDVLAQCCLRPLLPVSLKSLLSGCNHIISVPSVGIFKSCHRH
jgi:hypothetical protein